uniref:Uncharacterized protein n=1 Tax=Leptobrachium leishanense TaxID=445787 RepID=A0A8C5M0Z2_9ANUR
MGKKSRRLEGSEAAAQPDIRLSLGASRTGPGRQYREVTPDVAVSPDGSPCHSPEVPDTPRPQLSTKDDIRQLYEDLRALWQNDLTQVRAEIAAISSGSVSMGACLSVLEEERPGVQAQMEDLRKQVTALSSTVLDLETRHRRRNLRIRGIPETVSDEALLPCVSGLVAMLLTLPPDFPVPVTSAFRVRKAAAAPVAAPRDVIAVTTDVSAHAKVLKKAGNVPSVTYNDMQVTIYRDLSFLALAARRRFRDVTTHMRDRGLRYRWGPSGSLLILHGGTMHSVTTPDEARALLDDGMRPPNATASTCHGNKAADPLQSDPG